MSSGQLRKLCSTVESQKYGNNAEEFPSNADDNKAEEFPSKNFLHFFSLFPFSCWEKDMEDLEDNQLYLCHLLDGFFPDR